MKRIGRYQFTKTLHQSDEATIYLAHDPIFECNVAVKVIKLDKLPHETKMFHQSVKAEAQAIMSLKHAAILPLYDARIEKDQLYLVMPYLSGGSLTTRMQKKELSSSESIQLIRKLTPALALAHKKGIIHRNLKPTNVLFDDQEQPYLTDFAFPTLQHDLSSSRATSLAYNSPEQASYAYKVDQRSDIYALGVILFELLTGTRPYQAHQPRSLAYKHLYNPIPTPSALQTNLRPSYDQIIKKAIAKTPSARFNTMIEFHAALDSIIADEEASRFYTSIPYIPPVERGLSSAQPALDLNPLVKTRTPLSYQSKKNVDDDLSRSRLSNFLLDLRKLLGMGRTWPGIATLSLLFTILILLFLNLEYILGIIARSYLP